MNWALLQNGVGIDIQEGNFTAVIVKRQWKRIGVADRLEIPAYRSVGWQECGMRYREFLRRNGLKAPWTVVALPRSAVLLRWLNFPGAVETDLRQAVRFQLDSLHPFEEDSIDWDCAVSKKLTGQAAAGRIEAPVAIAEKSYVDEISLWFQQAGISVSQFTVNTAALLAAVTSRLEQFSRTEIARPPAVFLLYAMPAQVQIIGYTPGAVVSTEVSIAPGETETDTVTAVQRQLEVARSELRLDPEQRLPLVVCGSNASRFLEATSTMPFAVSTIDDYFPNLNAPGDSRMQDDAVAFAAALTAADRSLPFSLNLLPVERRSYQSPYAYVPAYALIAVALLLLMALGLRGSFQDWRYQQYVEREIESLQPQLQAVEAEQEHSRKTYEKLALLDRAKGVRTLPIQILGELTRLLPDDVYLQLLQYDGDSLSLVGVANTASPLLDTLSKSPYFESPQFLSAIGRYAEGKEYFRIGARIRKPK